MTGLQRDKTVLLKQQQRASATHLYEIFKPDLHSSVQGRPLFVRPTFKQLSRTCINIPQFFFLLLFLFILSVYAVFIPWHSFIYFKHHHRPCSALPVNQPVTLSFSQSVSLIWVNMIKDANFNQLRFVYTSRAVL